jgi:hypothetical protein
MGLQTGRSSYFIEGVLNFIVFAFYIYWLFKFVVWVFS